jgi:hypothetical protein
MYLVEVHLPSSLGLSMLRVKGGADLGEDFLRDPLLLLTYGEGLLPPHKLLLSREEQLLHLLNCRRRRHHRGRARRRRGRGLPRANVNKSATHR